MRAYYTTDGYAVGLARTDENQDGFPDCTHGGIIASYFDETLWHQTKRDNFHIDAMTVHVETDYFKPVPQGTDVTVVALPARIEGRHYYVSGALLLPDGSIAATGSAHYICLKTDNKISAEEQRRILHPSDCERKEVYF